MLTRYVTGEPVRGGNERFGVDAVDSDRTGDAIVPGTRTGAGEGESPS